MYPIKPESPPEYLDYEEKLRLRRAAFVASQKYPGVIGSVLGEYLRSWEEFGFRFGGDSQVNTLVSEILEE
jgi:hypothetical protein